MTSSGLSFTALGLEQVLEQMPAALVLVEAPSGRIIHFNARAREMSSAQLGREIPAELDENWEIFHPDGRPYAMEEWPLVRSITTGEEVVAEEYFNVLADGSRLIIRCNSSPIYDDGGMIVAGVLVMDDITEQRRAEEALAYHARLPDVVEDAIVGTDAEFRLTVWNRGAERLYGFTAAEVLGRNAREVATYKGDESRRKLERELLGTGRTRTELTAHRKDGTPVEVELITVAVRGERDEITGYVGIHRDVTERKGDARQAIESLTPREREVLQALGEGLDGKGIAGRLHISIRTERNHVASILMKLGVHSQLQAVLFAVRYGVIDVC